MASKHSNPEDYTADSEAVSPDTRDVDPAADRSARGFAAGPAAVQPAGPMDTPAAPRLETAEHRNAGKSNSTKLARLWTATVLAVLVLILLIIFIAQNQESVTLRYFGAQGQVNLGLALLIAAVGGALVVAIAGVARVLQLRAKERRQRKAMEQ